uniref:Integrase catalytic domain-containing protein n=1 Tax=Latimeria chalumnae TaxID=7897 RepID=H3ABI0_LATCH
FKLEGQRYTDVTDYYSNFPEMLLLCSTMIKAVINSIKSIFARQGVPDKVFTDNGPQFSSNEFKTFTHEWDFRYTTSSPHYPQSSGQVEKYVQTVKNMMDKKQG